MTFEVFSEAEVRYKYAKAENKAHMLRVLAELTCSTEEQMAKFLGVEIQSPNKGKINNAKAHRLYKKKMTDAQMATALGVSRQAVHEWRAARDLPPLSKPDEASRMEAYKRGLSDRKAGKELGLSREAFRAWRHRNGLAPNYNKKENET